MGQKKEKDMYLNSVTIVGFVGTDPEQRQAKGNGAKFTVLSVATQRSWKNAEEEWVSKTEWHRVAIFRTRLAQYVLDNIRKGSHVLVEGQEGPGHEDHLVVHLRRRRAPARPRRTGTGIHHFPPRFFPGSPRSVGRRSVLRCEYTGLGYRRGPFFSAGRTCDQSIQYLLLRSVAEQCTSLHA
jgi:hypothetical protein